MDDVPYVNATGVVRHGTLVSTLELNNDQTVKPTQHVVYFAGEHPCDRNGAELARIKHGSQRQTLDPYPLINREITETDLLQSLDLRFGTHSTIRAGSGRRTERDQCPFGLGKHAFWKGRCRLGFVKGGFFPLFLPLIPLLSKMLFEP
jgi:hypothetical protein